MTQKNSALKILQVGNASKTLEKVRGGGGRVINSQQKYVKSTSHPLTLQKLTEMINKLQVKRSLSGPMEG